MRRIVETLQTNIDLEISVRRIVETLQTNIHLEIPVRRIVETLKLVARVSESGIGFNNMIVDSMIIIHLKIPVANDDMIIIDLKIPVANNDN